MSEHCKAHGDMWEPGCKECEAICQEMCQMSVADWLIFEMKSGYKFKKMECPKCGLLVAENWYVRHMKKEHPRDKIPEEALPPRCYGPFCADLTLPDDDGCKGCEWLGVSFILPKTAP